MASNGDETLAEGIGDRIRRVRIARKMSEEGLADAIGVTGAAIRKIEAGESKQPSFTNGLLICEALEVDPWYLAFGQAVPHDLETQVAQIGAVGISLMMPPQASEADIASTEASIASALQPLGHTRVRPRAERRLKAAPTPPAASGETESLSPQQQRALLAIGGQALVDEMQSLRQRIDALERSQRSPAGQPQKRAAR